MKLGEAIDYLDTRAKDLEFQGFEREAKAQRLGIEALRREQSWRRLHPHLAVQPLEGETED